MVKSIEESGFTFILLYLKTCIRVEMNMKKLNIWSKVKIEFIRFYYSAIDGVEKVNNCELYTLNRCYFPQVDSTQESRVINERNISDFTCIIYKTWRHLLED